MPGLAVIVAVIHDGKVLLTKREDFEVWCLPGGGVEEDESLKEIYELRDRSGLTRQQFYLQRLEDAEINEVLEVGNV